MTSVIDDVNNKRALLNAEWKQAAQQAIVDVFGEKYINCFFFSPVDARAIFIEGLTQSHVLRLPHYGADHLYLVRRYAAQIPRELGEYIYNYDQLIDALLDEETA
jgi:hypothetical protein